MTTGFSLPEGGEAPEEGVPEVRHGETVTVPPKPVVTFTADQVAALIEALITGPQSEQPSE